MDHRDCLCLHDLLEVWTEHAPTAIAITAPRRAPLAYARLACHITEVVKALNASGVSRHDRIAIVLPNGPEMAVAVLATAATATSAPLNPAYRYEEYEFYLSDLRAKALIVEAGSDSPAVKAARQQGIPIIELSPSRDSEAGTFTLSAGAGSESVHPRFAQPDDVALVLHTSGTTSRPKIVPLTHRNILASALNIGTSLHLESSDRCLNIMPLFHIHGLIAGLLSSLVAGGSVVCPPSFDANKFFEWMAELHPTWYTAVPTMHYSILTHHLLHADMASLPALRFIRSSSSALPLQLREKLEEAFKVPVIEAYGMTEAAHQITTTLLPPGVRKVGSVGTTSGTHVAIMDQTGTLLGAGEIGEIVIRGDNVTRGYEDNPTANESAFRNGWLRTGDEGFLDQDGYLFIRGRSKEIINRGGEKISPVEVEAVLLAHPAVAEAVAFAVPHPQLGEDVAAAVVLHKHASTTEQDIREFTASRLADFKVPRRVTLLNELPKGSTGKLQRIGMAEKLGLTQPVSKRFVPPRETVDYQLVQIWEDLLHVSPIGINDNFFELGGHSLLAVQMMAEIERGCGKKLPLATLFAGATIEHLANALVAEQSTPNSLLVPFHPNGSRRPLFFLHGDYGGGGFYCLTLARALGDDQPFFALAPHGMDSHPLPDSIEAMAAAYIEIVRSVQPHGPYLLGGHCNGGVIAFEMAHQLLAQGEEVSLLVLIAASGLNARFRFVHHLISSVGSWLGLSVEEQSRRFRVWRERLIRLDRLPFNQKLTVPFYAALRVLKRAVLGRAPRPDDTSSVAAMSPPYDGRHPLYKVYRKLQDSYVPGPYPGRVTLLWPREEPVPTQGDPTTGWARAAREVLVHPVPGKHLTCITTHVEALAERLRGCLHQAEVDRGVGR